MYNGITPQDSFIILFQSFYLTSILKPIVFSFSSFSSSFRCFLLFSPLLCSSFICCSTLLSQNFLPFLLLPVLSSSMRLFLPTPNIVFSLLLFSFCMILSCVFPLFFRSRPFPFLTHLMPFILFP